MLTFVEELSLKEDLAVSDGDDISGNVGRHVTSLHTHVTVQNRVNWTDAHASDYFFISVSDQDSLILDPGPAF